MAQSTLDLILRTKKEGDAVKQSNKDLQNLKKSSNDLVRELTGLTLGVGTVAAGLKWMIGEAGESELATAKLEAVLKATGGAAGMTSDALNDLAGALSNMSGVDDEAIVSAEAVLLTFTKVGKEAFPEAMTAAMNLSAVLGTDLQSAVQMVGKALDNPAEGLTALTRAAGKFTDEEEKLIKGLVDEGRLEEAQTIILDKLEGKYGGAAKAMGDTMVGSVNKLKDAFNNLGEAIGTILTPAITWVAENAATALDASGQISTVDTAWGKFFNTMIKGGANAAEVQAAYNEKVREAEKAFNGAGYGMDKIIRGYLRLTTNESQYLRDQEGLQQALKISSKSADEYAMAVLGITDATKLASDNPFTKMLVAAAQAAYNAANGIKTHTAAVISDWNSMSAYSEEMKKYTQTQVEFTEAIEETSISMDTVQFAISGAVAGAWTDYQTTITDLTAEHDELTTKAQNLLDRGYSPLGRTIGEVNAALAENETKQLDAAAAAHAATNEMIFQQASAGLDAAATLELAKSMGMISDEDYAIATTLQHLKEALDNGEISAATYAKEVANISAAVNSLHDKAITVTVTTISNEVAGGRVIPPHEDYQTGGQWTVAGPSGLDSVPVSFWATAGETVTVTPAGMSAPGGGGGNVTIAPGAIVVNAVAGMDEARLADEMMRRLSQAVKRSQKAGEKFLGNG